MDVPSATPPRSQTHQHISALLNLEPFFDRSLYDDDAVRQAIRRDPNAAREKYSFPPLFGHDYPLLQAVSLGASVGVIRMMYDACPESIGSKDLEGWTPLHHACLYETRLDVIRFLVETYPNAMEMKNRSGCTPLHVACYNEEAPVDALKLLAMRCPAALGIKDQYGKTPLHHLVTNRDDSLHFVQFLVELYPRALEESDKEGCKPLITDEHISGELENLFGTLRSLHCQCPSDESISEMLVQTPGWMWDSRVVPILNCRPSVVHRLGIDGALIPILLERIVRNGRVQTLFGIIKESVGLFKDLDPGCREVKRRAVP